MPTAAKPRKTAVAKAKSGTCDLCGRWDSHLLEGVGACCRESMDGPREQALIRTVSGRLVDLLSPAPESLCVQDIAHALARLARFNGHTRGPVCYSVAQHSLWVAAYLERVSGGDQALMLHGLLHDAAEAYLGDMLRPLKQVSQVEQWFRLLERQMLVAIYAALHLPFPTPDEAEAVRHADAKALTVEHDALVMPGTWSPRKHKEGVQKPMPAQEAEALWLSYYWSLSKTVLATAGDPA